MGVTCPNLHKTVTRELCVQVRLRLIIRTNLSVKTHVGQRLQKGLWAMVEGSVWSPPLASLAPRLECTCCARFLPLSGFQQDGAGTGAVFKGSGSRWRTLGSEASSHGAVYPSCHPPTPYRQDRHRLPEAQEHVAFNPHSPFYSKGPLCWQHPCACPRSTVTSHWK